MTSPRVRCGSRSRAAGFSITELVIVVGIILLMAAVSTPAIARYIKNYQIRGATQQVAGEMQTARMKAIVKNVNLGVAFAVLSPTQYRWVIEDDQDPQTAPNWFAIPNENWATLTADTVQAGTARTLPPNVRFVDTATCPPVVAANTWGVRFTRLGSMCEFGTATCGAAPPAGVATNLVNLAGGTATVCLQEITSGLVRTVRITSGGRVLAQP